MNAPSRRQRIAAQLADLKMPGALESLDEVLAGVDGGGFTAAEAIERLLAAQIALRNGRRLATMGYGRKGGVRRRNDDRHVGINDRRSAFHPIEPRLQLRLPSPDFRGVGTPVAHQPLVASGTRTPARRDLRLPRSGATRSVNAAFQSPRDRIGMATTMAQVVPKCERSLEEFGMERQRRGRPEGLRRQAGWRFGADAGERLDELLGGRGRTPGGSPWRKRQS